MASKSQNILVVSHHSRIGAGETKVYYIDSYGSERLVWEGSNSCHQNWLNDLNPIIRESIDSGITKAIFDLEKIPWVNATFLSQLLTWCHEFEANGGEIVFASPAPRVSKIFKLTKLDLHLQIFDTLEKAVAFYQGK